ncbi:MAG: AAA family ATPase [Bacteroidia bacterium]
MIWQLHPNYDWNELRDTFSWIQDMEGVPQNPQYHAEGDVAIHTRMVLEALQQMPAYDAQTEQNQHLLKATALLHDIEKRSTTRLENGKLTSRGHARKGAKTTNALLYRMGNTPFDIRRSLVGLVRHHGLPIWAMEKPDPVKTLLSTAFEVNHRLLATFAEADVRGRICDDQPEMLERIQFFQAFAEEQACLEAPRHFKSASSAFHYFQLGGDYPDYVPFEKPTSEVTVLCGLPGSGKDYYIQRYLEKDLPVISLDALRRSMKKSPTDKKATGRIVQEAKEQARVFLRKKENFVWNATNITRQMREQLIALFASYGATIHLVYIEVPYATLLKQNRNREYPIPESVLESMIDKIELPVPTEAHSVRYFT